MVEKNFETFPCLFLFLVFLSAPQDFIEVVYLKNLLLSFVLSLHYGRRVLMSHYVDFVRVFMEYD